MAARKKKAALLRGGDLIRIMWKMPNTRGKCLSCEWTSREGSIVSNLGREAIRHTRKTGHTTRIAYTEVIEYRGRDHERKLVPEGLPCS